MCLSSPLNSSTPDVSLKPRVSEALDLQGQQHNGAPYLPLSRAPFPAVTVDQSISTYSGITERRRSNADSSYDDAKFSHWLNPTSRLTGNPITAVYAISANRPGYSDYFVMSSYRSPSWMSYPPEQDDLPRQWNDTPVRHMSFSTRRAVKHFTCAGACLSPRCEAGPLFSPQNSRHLETIC